MTFSILTCQCNSSSVKENLYNSHIIAREKKAENSIMYYQHMRSYKCIVRNLSDLSIQVVL
jgi:hypothetical protein